MGGKDFGIIKGSIVYFVFVKELGLRGEGNRNNFKILVGGRGGGEVLYLYIVGIFNFSFVFLRVKYIKVFV